MASRFQDVEGLRVPFGLKGRRLFAPSEVANGLACGCTCPACESRLVAKHPTSGKRDHFSHHRQDNCLGGYETAVHLMAKQIIADAGWVTLPEKKVTVQVPIPLGDALTDAVPYPQHQRRFTSVVQEVSEGVWRPDLTAELQNGETLYIEILVSHQVEERKAEALDNLMEIDLSRLPLETATDPVALRQAVLETAPRKWYRCPLYDELPSVERLRAHLAAMAACDSGRTGTSSTRRTGETEERG